MSEFNPRQHFLREIGQKALHDPRAGAAYVAGRLGVSARRVRWQAIQPKPWPAVWFKALMQISIQHDVQISLEDFQMREIDKGDGGRPSKPGRRAHPRAPSRKV